MTQTEELRALLEGRGAEYTEREMFGKHVFHWGEPVVNGAMYTDGGDWSELVVENATPEQAIEATLGRGTCRMVTDEGAQNWWSCSACDCDGYSQVLPSYCPWCGRKVEE